MVLRGERGAALGSPPCEKTLSGSALWGYIDGGWGGGGCGV